VATLLKHRSKAIVRQWIPLAISAAALIAVLSVADLDAFRGLASRAQWSRIPLLILLLLSIVIAVGWRWRTLMLKALTVKRSVVVTALGLGGNQILPLRGGDALRVVLSARGQEAPSLHVGVSALAMEKVFDLVAVAAFGLASTAAVLAPASESQLNVTPIAISILTLATAALLTARSGLLISGFRYVARLMHLPARLYRHLLRPLHHLQESATPGRVVALLIETAVIWLVLYVVAYLVIAQLVGMSLGVTDAMVLLFAAALGLAIPAAPSGIGTFHAAIVSAFVLLGKPASEGLVLAVAIHGVFFIGFCASGIAALAVASHGAKPLRVRGESV
jgi:uncharacterized protein (TIRG00374 family)